MNATLSVLIERLGNLGLAETRVIPWGCPVPAFGDLSRSRIATLGLNPSNREFVDEAGNELDGAARRFHTLTSLGLNHWLDASTKDLELIMESCRAYFLRNPYDGWFRQLEHIISGTETSYYDSAAQACHLDLIPYATACKWTSLSPDERRALLKIAGDTLGHLLKDSPVRVLILNGMSVVERFEQMAEVCFERKMMPRWALRRGGESRVAGFAYKGKVKMLAGTKFKREILALGFNHNIQSSFGVTREVRAAIRNWITGEVRSFSI